MRECNVCFVTKPLDDFYRRKLRKDGTFSYDLRCKKCQLEIAKKYNKTDEDENIVMPNGQTRMANLIAKLLHERKERIASGGPRVITKALEIIEESKTKRSRGRTPTGLCGVTKKMGKYYCYLVNQENNKRQICGSGFKTREEAHEKATRIDLLKASGNTDWIAWKLA